MFFTTTQQEKPTRRYRMYGLVPYNISPIQQAIQFGHAVVEYANEYFHDHDYQSWSHDDKTFIILYGGTTNTLIERFGTLNNYKLELEMKSIKTAHFHEPDLGDQLTAVVFLVDDRVWDRETYPDYAGSFISDLNGTRPMENEFNQWKKMFSDNHEEADRIVWMRDFLRNFRLA